MPVIHNVAFDCAEPYRLARFWSAVMRQPISDEAVPGDAEVEILTPDGPNLFFQQVPEPKSVKNRVHICLVPETTRDTEVSRVLKLGATIVADRRVPDGTGWVVFADPEGNEFCVLRSAAERHR
ncbi:putative enzyme related to lactoylglutathione lyase [Allocatelliglobosispora scoriae]|uniref:Putative enzyme related to lactoylglutathione lyase n=1 Tax=Allocatelliglobosispora scoriae TaxID=643052 RepID=A0A841BJA4_9ACTN|nr:VOC family protein [Allocatelliglobosispora scoriae]MBB5867705.1 putative enzyme related to lactoylglutathione lyase [Allocatelliglobosispora scoriae]